MTSPEGFGAAATGGGNATPITVTTYTALKNALNSTTTANSVILVSGIIDCVYTSVTLNNKTIIGLPGARLRNLQITPGNSTASANASGILYIKPGSNNVIIRNLIFEGPGAYDVDGRDNLTNEGTNVWVDHCEFQDGMDGNFDNKGAADNVSISWCKFTYLKPAIAGGSGGSADHRFTNLVGSAITDFPADGRYSITFQNNYFAEGCKARMPRARNAELHVLNCYYKTSVSGASAIGLGAGNSGTTCYVENTNFEQITNISTPVNEGTGTTSVKFAGSIKGTSGADVTGLDQGTALKPTYAYTTMPVADVATSVSNATCGAGATLQVSSAGVISSSCAPLATNEVLSQLGLKYYPSIVKDILNIDFLDKSSGKTDLKFYSVTGQKALSVSKKINSGEKLNLNLGNLPAGVYICNVTRNEKSTSFKFIKK
ncbi:T9SS type A sorting domain-containing protein [Halpernia frigidisoli]|nr:T9SS type A sorting domain-containing protein [Halpernia frigidisoli]